MVLRWAEAHELLLTNAQRHLQPIPRRASAFKIAPEAILNTTRIAGQCTFELSELRYEYPEELAPDGMSPIDYLEKLTWQGAAKRYPSGTPSSVEGLLKHELNLIRDLKYEAYFLTVWDLVRFARSREILCQGRGSAANSAVCFCLEITAVDPATTDVLFERFISKERDEAPDIDVDFEHERREEVLQYLVRTSTDEQQSWIGCDSDQLIESAVLRCVMSEKHLGLSLDQGGCLWPSTSQGYWSGFENLAERECVMSGIDPRIFGSRQSIALSR